jgi:hypothetical protein
VSDSSPPHGSGLPIFRQPLRCIQLATIYIYTILTTRYSMILPRSSLQVRLQIPAQSPCLIRTTLAAQVLFLGFRTQNQMTHMNDFVWPYGKPLRAGTVPPSTKVEMEGQMDLPRLFLRSSSQFVRPQVSSITSASLTRSLSFILSVVCAPSGGRALT